MGEDEKEICANCGRKIGLSEQAYVFKGLIICTECDKKLRMASQPTPVSSATIGEGAAHQPLAWKTTKVLTFVGVAAVSALIVYFALTVFWGRDSFPYKITYISGYLDRKGKLGPVAVAIHRAGIWGGWHKSDEYALVYTFDSKEDMAKISREVINGSKEVIDASKLEPARGHYIASIISHDGKRRLRMGRYGRGALGYSYTYKETITTLPIGPPVTWWPRKSVKGVCIYGIELFPGLVPEYFELDLHTGSLLELTVTGPVVVVKAQVWSRYGDDWGAASHVFEVNLPVSEEAQ